VRSQNGPLVASLSERLRWFHQNVLQVVPRTNGWLVGLKTALSFFGLCQEVFAEPLHPMSEAERERLQGNLVQLRTMQEF
jgi:2-dehydro-3-deoxy-D-pentonate aldolase